MKSLTGRLLVLSLVVGVWAVGGNASSVDADSVTRINQWFVWVPFATVVAQGSAGGQVQMQRSDTKSRTVSGSVGVSGSLVQATLGYSHTTSQTVNYSYTRSATNRRTCYRISASDRFQRDSIRWTRVRFDVFGVRWSTTGTATLQDHRAVSFSTNTKPLPASGRC